MSDRNSLDVTGVPEVFLEALDHLTEMLRHNLPPGEPPATVKGVPFDEWRDRFYEWMSEYSGRPVFDDSRYTMYDGFPPLTEELLHQSGAPAALRPGRYRHFKGGEYEVVGVAKHSETQEPMVVYRPLYQDSGMWVRPLAMFLETVVRDGVERPRFEYLVPM